ncbi:DUF4910 domain-containing protein [Candidatus Pelagibacter bacterium]|nr:DUF4910 domain-containing protein [Candidatus Pelagibacter bacterium]
MAKMLNNNNPRWRKALDKIWHLNRVHVSTEMSLAYKLLKKFYKNTTIFGYPTGSKINEWIAPPGWDVQHATLKDPEGKVLADWKKNKLSLWTYSPSFKGFVTKDQILKKIFFAKKKPNDTIFQFRNQYNFPTAEWGFCLPYKNLKKLKSGKYEVNIKTKTFKGKLEMAEQVHNGKYKDSILFLGHFDHPQMCLDGLAGCLAGHEVISNLKNKKTKLTYRMLSTVEIVGSVFYANKKAKKNKIKEAVFIASPGAKANLNYQKSFSNISAVDNIMEHCLKYFDENSKIWNFRKGPLGNDEIAYDVGGVNIPCGSIINAPFKTYHTDKDIPSGVNEKKFNLNVILINEIIHILENNSYVKRNFVGLPKLSSKKYDLYLTPARVSGKEQDLSKEKKFLSFEIPSVYHNYIETNTHKFNHLMNTIPNMCEGNHTILDIANFVQLPFRLVENYINLWVKKKLIKKKWVYPFKINVKKKISF